jgi:hypothetical protein
VTDFRDLVGGDDLSPEEESRLRRVHELLLAAGPPEELPPALAAPPAEPRAKVLEFPVRRRRGAVLVLAASLAALLFGGGYWLGAERHAFKSEEYFVMHGPSPQAFASIELAPADAAHNWPLLVRVRGLEDLPAGGYYELLLTKNGKPGPSCGTFRTHNGKTRIVLNAPYPLNRWNGWIVVAHQPNGHTSPPVLTTHLS